MFGVTWLALILFTLFYNGLAGINFAVVAQDTPPPGSTDGGLRNAIIGSVIMTVIGVGIGAPLGLFAGTYLAEYGKHDKLTSVIRFINDILLSAPSIIIGLFIYGAIVVPMGGFSGLGGSPIAPPAPASSPACCSVPPASPAKPRRCCSPRSPTSSSAWT